MNYDPCDKTCCRDFFLFSAKYFHDFVNNKNTTVYEYNFVFLGVPTYKSYVFTRKEE